MSRIRWVMATIVVASAACADDAPAHVSAVAIAATPCDRPTARLGVGTVVAEGLVLTAAHVVEDDLRRVEVDGRPARVVALDTRIDVAVLSLDTPIDQGAATMGAADVTDAVRIITPTGVIDTTVGRVVTLSVDDTTDGVVHRRRALVLAGALPDGTSGAPVVGNDGNMVGMVTIAHVGRDVTYATAATEIRRLVDSAVTPGQPATRSSLAAQEPCA